MTTWKYGGELFKHALIRHPLSAAVNADLRRRLDVGPFPRGGYGGTVHNTGGGDNQTSGAVVHDHRGHRELGQFGGIEHPRARPAIPTARTTATCSTYGRATATSRSSFPGRRSTRLRSRRRSCVRREGARRASSRSAGFRNQWRHSIMKIEDRHPGALASQWIPRDRHMWKLENY